MSKLSGPKMLKQLPMRDSRLAARERGVKEGVIKKLRKVSRLPYSFKYTIIYKTTIVRLSISGGIAKRHSRYRGIDACA